MHIIEYNINYTLYMV